MEVYITWDIEYSDGGPIGVFSNEERALTLTTEYFRKYAGYSEDIEFDWVDDTEDTGKIVEVVDGTNYIIAYWQKYTLDRIDE